MIYASGGDQIQEMQDIDRKNIKRRFWKKKKINWICLSYWVKLREAEGHLSMSSCLQDAVINSAPRIGKYTNKLELYIQ